MKKYILIAGVNGTGKSTLFHVLDELSDMLRVNTDEIVRQFGDWNNKSDVFKKSSNLVRRLWACKKMTNICNIKWYIRLLING